MTLSSTLQSYHWLPSEIDWKHFRLMLTHNSTFAAVAQLQQTFIIINVITTMIIIIVIISIIINYQSPSSPPSRSSSSPSSLLPVFTAKHRFRCLLAVSKVPWSPHCLTSDCGCLQHCVNTTCTVRLGRLRTFSQFMHQWQPLRINVASFTEIHPLSKEMSRHTK